MVSTEAIGGATTKALLPAAPKMTADEYDYESATDESSLSSSDSSPISAVAGSPSSSSSTRGSEDAPLRRRRPRLPASSTAPKSLLSSSSSFSSSSSSSPRPSGLVGRLLPWIGLLVWPGMLALPLFLNGSSTSSSASSLERRYSEVFPRSWYAKNGEDWLQGEDIEGGVWEWGTRAWNGAAYEQPGVSSSSSSIRPLRHPLGMILGILAVVVGHVVLLVYFKMHRNGTFGPTLSVQRRGPVPYNWSQALVSHLAQPGGFLLLGLYLAGTWIFDLLPPSYYSFEGGIQYMDVAKCLVVQDFCQFVMHLLEHQASARIYRASHKPHHKFTNPKLFDAFDGSVPDTILMILLPLFATANAVRTCNVWTYMAFGSTYANWLTLIHSETVHPWEPVLFRRLGLGTSADHHVHHRFFKYNFGHLFLWFDMVWGTWRSPRLFYEKQFNEGV